MSAAEVHRCKWELRKREEEIAELQKTLSDTQVYFMEEREHNLKLQAENDAMKSAPAVIPLCACVFVQVRVFSPPCPPACLCRVPSSSRAGGPQAHPWAPGGLAASAPGGHYLLPGQQA